MAARGYVHSARAFPRKLTGTCNKVATILSTSHCQTRPRACRLRAFPVLSRTQADTTRRTMATSLPITRQDPTKIAKQPRQKTSYEEAVVALNSLQSNAETIRKSLQHRNETRKYNIPNMINYLRRVGLSLDDVDKLSIIHVTGTKGKGSTCAFTESILRQYGYKTGIFSSPHLIEVRERIRINGRPIDRDLFSSSFWDVFDKLQASKEQHEGSMPHYFSFLTVMALYIFVRERVDVAVLEVGIGGQYDSTNLVRSPVVCGVSSLDYDHTNLLGPTLEDIAWHKAGIFKQGAQAVTVPQPDSVMKVILNRSHENECPLSIAAPLTREELSPSGDVCLGIAGRKQLYNAALAVQLCQLWLSARETNKPGKLSAAAENGETETTGTSVENIPVRQSAGLSQQMIKGLSECQWPGRTQTIYKPGVTYYLDGAHTADSMQQCVEWFQEAADKERKMFKGKVWRGLVFNMTGDRPVSCLLKKLKDCEFDMAAFCPNVVSTIASKNIPDQLNMTVEQDTVLKKTHTNRQAWDRLFLQPPDDAAAVEATDITVSNGSSAHTSCPCNGSEQNHVTNGRERNGEIPSVLSQECVSDCFPCIASALQWVTFKQATDGEGPTTTATATTVVGSKWDVNENVDHVQVMVTGSLHLVGGVLELLTPNMND